MTNTRTLPAKEARALLASRLRDLKPGAGGAYLLDGDPPSWDELINQAFNPPT